MSSKKRPNLTVATAGAPADPKALLEQVDVPTSPTSPTSSVFKALQGFKPDEGVHEGTVRHLRGIHAVKHPSSAYRKAVDAADEDLQKKLRKEAKKAKVTYTPWEIPPIEAKPVEGVDDSLSRLVQSSLPNYISAIPGAHPAPPTASASSHPQGTEPMMVDADRGEVWVKVYDNMLSAFDLVRA